MCEAPVKVLDALLEAGADPAPALPSVQEHKGALKIFPGRSSERSSIAYELRTPRAATYVCERSNAPITGTRYHRCDDGGEVDLCEAEYEKLDEEEKQRYVLS